MYGVQLYTILTCVQFLPWMKYTMDQITIKTPNPKCRLYWCFIEFIDWRIKSVMLVFRQLVWTSAPLTFLLVDPPLPLLCTVSTGVCIYTVFNRGEGASDRWTPAAKSLYMSIFKKRRPLGFGVFIIIWSINDKSRETAHLRCPEAIVLVLKVLSSHLNWGARLHSFDPL